MTAQRSSRERKERKKMGERRRRAKLKSRKAGAGEWMNECVVALLCPALEWSVRKLSSDW